MAKNTAKKNPQQKISDIFVSVVVPADQAAGRLDKYIRQLSAVLARHYANYETLIVDNGMSAAQVEEVSALLNTVPCIRLLRLSRRHSYDVAIFSGLEASIGDYVCTLNPAMDSPEIIAELVARNRTGVDIVQGVSSIPIGGDLYQRWGRNVFYWYNRKFLHTEIPLNATYLASFNRRAVNALTSTARNYRYIRHLSRHIGFKLETLTYTPLHNPRSEKTMKTGFVEALEIITSLSSHPLRFVTGLGVTAAVINLMYALYVVVINLVKGHVAEGWTTLSMQASAMFFFLFSILAIMSEYLGRILVESRHEPPYHIMEELNSTVAIADETRRNITT